MLLSFFVFPLSMNPHNASGPRESSMDQVRAALERSPLNIQQSRYFAGLAAGIHLKICGTIMLGSMNEPSPYALSPEEMAKEDGEELKEAA
jgi:hypothetical protein